jgi:hypothetical protein
MDKLGFPFPRPGLVKGSYAGSVEERLINAKAGFRKWVACVQKKESFAWQDLEVAVWQRDGDVSDVYSSQKKQQRADNKAEKKARTRRKKSLRPVHYTEATRQSRNPAQGLCEYGKVVTVCAYDSGRRPSNINVYVSRSAILHQLEILGSGVVQMVIRYFNLVYNDNAVLDQAQRDELKAITDRACTAVKERYTKDLGSRAAFSAIYAALTQDPSKRPLPPGGELTPAAPVHGSMAGSKTHQKRVSLASDTAKEKIFKTGDIVTCPACKRVMQSPSPAEVLVCANCQARICVSDKKQEEHVPETKQAAAALPRSTDVGPDTKPDIALSAPALGVYVAYQFP